MELKFFATAIAWRKWLEEHHSSERELLVGFYKRESGLPSMTWPESVDQALCFGWIDGVRRRIDDERYSIRFCPRRPRSVWSLVNVRRVGELTELGLMQAAGLQAFAARSAERTGIYSFERVEAQLSAAQLETFKGNAPGWNFFVVQPPWYQKAAIFWVVNAKRDETQERRLAALIANSAETRLIGPLRRPQRKNGLAQNHESKASPAS